MKTLVLVADGGAARLLAMEGPPALPLLSEIAAYERPSAHLPRKALTTDRTGRVFDRAGRGLHGGVGQTRHGADSEYDPHAAEVERFARGIARRLDDERRRSRAGRLILVAEPRFLGLLRPLLSPASRRLVSLEVARDMIHADLKGIARGIVRAGWGAA